MAIAVDHLSRVLGGELRDRADAEGCDSAAEVTDVATLERAEPGQLAYLESEKHLPRLKHCRAGVLIVHPSLAERASETFGGTLLTVSDPQGAFIQAMLLLRPPRPRSTIGISPQAIIDPTARIGAGCNVFPLAVIGADVVVGENCDIHPGVVIGDGCVIGRDVTLHPGVVLYADTRLGDRVIVHAHAVIGADGFGYRFAEGRFHKLPHTGRAIIGDDVEIGAAATIDRAMIDATVVGEGTKIDNLVMIAHNCEIGRHNAFASQVGFAGSCRTGDYVRCGGQAGIGGHLSVGDGATVGPQAGVIWDVPAGEKHHGAPAGPDKEKIRVELATRKLPEMRKQLQDLARQVAALQQAAESADAAAPEPVTT
ncbi:MAG: UDP-3-O-(3-hydroxymyristoyl)glucosamine N-acyltransferase [Planctomycetaceae bacterium]